MKTLTIHWKKYCIIIGLICGLLCACIPSLSLAEMTAEEVRHLNFEQLGLPKQIKLTGYQHLATAHFSVRRDELVVGAKLTLRYSYSPALLNDQSHIKVMLNDEVVKTLLTSKEQAGQTLVQEIELDPRMITPYNQLSIQFIGHYSNECEDLLNNTLWADISSKSELVLNMKHLPMQSDLAILPEPFFDVRDNRILTLPVIFAGETTTASLQAAAVASSWFGKLAAWRGARFPVKISQLVAGHALVFATNQQRPDFIKDLPLVNGPTLQIITNPVDNHSKLLLILGQNDQDLQKAARGLVLANAAMSGDQIIVQQTIEHAPRQAYDAPNWVRTDRPTRLAELITSNNQLQMSDRSQDMIRLNLRIPPDLFAWRSNGVPMNLKYRYTPPDNAMGSQLLMSINDEMLRAFKLQAAEQHEVLRLPVVAEFFSPQNKELNIPAFKLGIHNQLQYQFKFNHAKTGSCRDSLADGAKGMIDKDSTIDFSGFFHYAEMPNLGYFAYAGFPFTKYADLSQTAVVMPNKPQPSDIEVLLSLMGRMGESTGYPATHVKIVDPEQANSLKEHDILLIGTLSTQKLLTQWKEHLPTWIDGVQKKISQPTLNGVFPEDYLGNGSLANPQISHTQQLSGSGKLAALLGFESPLSSGRSVVAITATDSSQLLSVLNTLEDKELIHQIRGSAVLIRGDNKVENFLLGKTYQTGSIPWFYAVWFWLSEHPILLAVMTCIGMLILAILLWRTLRAIARHRLGGHT